MCHIKAIPISLKQAQAYIDELHRHHTHSVGDKYRVGAEVDGKLVGVVQVGRPVSRYMDNGKTLEVIRLCTDGTKDVCSFLYAKAARIAKEMGYEKIITYILDTESGVSLKASGWVLEDADCGGDSWHREKRPRTLTEEQMSFYPMRQKYSTAKKQRWSKQL